MGLWDINQKRTSFTNSCSEVVFFFGGARKNTYIASTRKLKNNSLWEGDLAKLSVVQDF